jgi:hypothetical protein
MGSSISEKVKDLERGGALGKRVFRLGPIPPAVSDLVAAVGVPLFLVRSGDILLTHIYGTVTVQTGANNTTIQLRHTPVGGAAAVMCTASGNLNATAINRMLTITGAVGVGMALSAAPGIAIASFMTNLQILVPGTIDILVGGVVPQTGAIDWCIHYIPLDTDSDVIPQ